MGPIPAGMKVCHSCDNAACWRPAHLFLGTQRDNMQDAGTKGRMGAAGKRLTREQLSAMGKLGAKAMHAKHGDFSARARAVQHEMYLRGEWRPAKAKLTPPEVAEIRRRYAEGVRPRFLARDFGLSTSAVHRVVAGKTYANVPELYEDAAKRLEEALG